MIQYGGIDNDLAKIIRKPSIMGERIDKAIWSDLYQDLELQRIILTEYDFDNYSICNATNIDFPISNY